LKNWGVLCRQLDELRASMSIDGAAPIRSKIKEIVPEYSFHEDLKQEKVAELQAESHLQKAVGHS